MTERQLRPPEKRQEKCELIRNDKRDLSVDSGIVSSTMDCFVTPPDGGWGWMVVLSSFVIHVIADGIVYSSGMFLMEFVVYFKTGRGAVAWIGALQPAVTFTVGPLASVLTTRYGCRKVTIAGALIASAGFIGSVWAPGLYYLYFTSGVMAGVGFGLIYLPAIVCVAQYFEKKRSFATGLAVCGSGFGTFILAPFTGMLVRKFSWQVAMLVLGVLILIVIVCGIIFRPLEANVLPAKETSSDLEDDALLSDIQLQDSVSQKGMDKSTNKNCNDPAARQIPKTGKCYRGIEGGNSGHAILQLYRLQHVDPPSISKTVTGDGNNCSNGNNSQPIVQGKVNGLETAPSQPAATSYDQIDEDSLVPGPQYGQHFISEPQISQHISEHQNSQFGSEPQTNQLIYQPQINQLISQPQNSHFVYHPQESHISFPEPSKITIAVFERQDSHLPISEPRNSQLEISERQNSHLSFSEHEKSLIAFSESENSLHHFSKSQNSDPSFSESQNRPRSIPEPKKLHLSFSEHQNGPHSISEPNNNFKSISQSQNSHQHIPKSQNSHNPISEQQNSHLSFSESQNSDYNISEQHNSLFSFSEPQNSQLYIPEHQYSNHQILLSQNSNHPISESEKNINLFSETQNSHLSFSEPKNIRRPISKAQNIDQPISEPKNIRRPISKTQNVDQPISEPKNIRRPISKAQNIDQPISEPKNIRRPISKTQNIDQPISEPQINPLPFSKPQNSHQPINEPQISDPPLSHSQNSHLSLSDSQNSHLSLSDSQNSYLSLSESQNSHLSHSEQQNSHISNLEPQNSHISNFESQSSPPSNVALHNYQPPMTVRHKIPASHAHSDSSLQLRSSPRSGLRTSASSPKYRTYMFSGPTSRSFAVLSAPLSRKDIFYSGSLSNIPMYRSQPDVYRAVITISKDQEPRSISETAADKKYGRGVAFLHEIRTITNNLVSLNLLKNPVFLMFAVSNFFTSLGFNMPFIFLPDRAILAGIDANNAALLVSVIGIANTVGRILFGYLSDRPWVNRLVLYNTALTICGVVTALSPVVGGDYGLLVTYAAIFGLFIGVYVSLTSIVLVDLLGLDHLTNSFGLLLLFQGTATFVGPPIAGWLCDWTGSYDISFFLMGSLIAVSGAMLYFLPAVERHYAHGLNKAYTVRDLELGKRPVTSGDVEIISAEASIYYL